MPYLPTTAPSRPQRPIAPLFAPPVARVNPFPIQHLVIDWDRLVAKRSLVLETVHAMPRYLLKPEVLTLLAAETHPMYRLILDLMWGTGARISEVLALTPSRIHNDGQDLGVVLQTSKQRVGRPSKAELISASKRYVPIVDPLLRDRIEGYLLAGRFKRTEALFPITRQTVTRRVHKLVARVGGASFNVTAHTFRHSFAIHLLLHGRPLKYIAQLLGHRSTESTEIYTHILTVDGGHFLDGVDFH